MTIGQSIKKCAKIVIPAPVRLWLRRVQVRLSEKPIYKFVDFGSFRQLNPIHYGFEMGRGQYIDRYYIEDFLKANSSEIKGRVLELADNEYTRRFGGDKVVQSDVLDVRAGYPAATIVADLTQGNNIPSGIFDCILLIQTLNFIYDVRAAIRTVHRILKPGGCVLVSVPGISQIVPMEMEYCGDYWRFTHLSLRTLFEETFPKDHVTVETRGNVLAAISFLQGLAAEELRREELDYHDPEFEVSILLKAFKPSE